MTDDAVVDYGDVVAADSDGDDEKDSDAVLKSSFQVIMSYLANFFADY